jgi:hypothetical protein
MEQWARTEHAQVTMLGLDERQRGVLADKVPAMANLVAAAIVIVFILGEPATSISVMTAAITCWIGALGLAVARSRKKG